MKAVLPFTVATPVVFDSSFFDEYLVHGIREAKGVNKVTVLILELEAAADLADILAGVIGDVHHTRAYAVGRDVTSRPASEQDYCELSSPNADMAAAAAISKS